MRRLLFIGSVFFFLGTSAYGLWVYSVSPPLEMQLADTRKGLWIRSVQPGSEVERSGIRGGDFLVRVEKFPIHSHREFQRILLINHHSGMPLVMGVRRGETLVDFSVARFHHPLELRTLLVFYGFGMILWLLGVYAYVLRPGDYAVGVAYFLFFTLSLAAMTYVLPFTRPFTYGLNIILTMLYPSTLIHFAAAFPNKKKLPSDTRWVVIGAYALTVYLVGSHLLAWQRFLEGSIPFSVMQWLDRRDWGYFAGGSLAAGGVAFKSYLRSTWEERQQFKWTFLGFFLGFFPVIFFWGIPSAFGLTPIVDFEWAFFPGNIFLISLIWGIFKYRIFDVDFYIRRSLLFAAVTGGSLLVYLGGVGLLSLFTTSRILDPSPRAAVLATLGVALAFDPLRRRAQRTITRFFFPERYGAQQVFRMLGQELAATLEMKEVTRKTLAGVQSALGVHHAVFFLAASPESPFVLMEALGTPPEKFLVLELERRSALALWLGERRVPYQQEKEKQHGYESPLLLEDVAWLRTAYRVDTFLPLLHGTELVGILGLGEKRSGAGYTRDDEDLLGGFMNQVGTSVMNARMHESLAEKAVQEQVYRRFLSPQLVDRVIHNPATMHLGGEIQKATILFADIRGFTTWAEKTPPQEIVERLNVFFSAMTEEIFRFGGTLDKFLGDGLMALFGAPIVTRADAALAVQSAVAMLRRLDVLNRGWVEAGQAPFRMGIGITTGLVTVGNIGSEQRMDYTAIGDPVNLAARLQAMAQGGEILMNDATAAEMPAELTLEALEPLLIKGKANKVAIFKLIPKADVPTGS